MPTQVRLVETVANWRAAGASAKGLKPLLSSGLLLLCRSTVVKSAWFFERSQIARFLCESSQGLATNFKIF